MTATLQPRWGAVVVAAGRGERFGDGDKLLAPLAGRAVVAWAVDAIVSEQRVCDVVVVTGPENGIGIRDAIGSSRSGCGVTYCAGGPTRSASVVCGLAALAPGITHVAVHDGARPLVAPEHVRQVLDAAERAGAATLALQPASTIGVLDSGGRELAGSLDRSRLLELQTPQAAARDALCDALFRFPDETDESSALFRAGYNVAIVDGSRGNIKITVPEDLRIAGALARVRATLT